MRIRAIGLTSTSIVLAASLVTAACGGDDESGSGGGGGGTSETCSDFSNASGSPSFKDDVMPVFSLSCALSASCHAAPTGMEGLVLGQPNAMGPPDQTLIDNVHANLVGTASTESSLPRVEAGNPGGSWLMLKVGYTLEELTSTCDTGCTDDCGDPMPPPGGGLDAERRDIIAAWIASGAPNN
jgi:hypothetical protein